MALTDGLHWLGHSAFRWEGSKIIYFDPWKLARDPKKAGIVFVSHEHFDHMSKPDISAVSSPSTVVVTCKAASGQLKADKIGCREVIGLSAGDEMDIQGINVKAIASYNTDKKFHTKDSGKLGFVVTMDGVSVYHAGDTDIIPEMSGVKCDIALLPVSGEYVMSADEAAEAALVIRPKAAIPMHYGDIVGEISDAERFKELLSGKVEVKIIRREDKR